MKVALADLLQSIRLPTVDSALVELSVSGGVRFVADNQVFLYLALAGRVTLHVADSEQVLEPGDYAVVFGRLPHMLSAGRLGSVAKSDYFCSRHALDAPPTIRFGRGRLASVLLACSFHLRGAHPLVRALPRQIVMTTAAVPDGLRLHADSISRCVRGPGASGFITSMTDMLFMQAVRHAVHDLFANGTPGPSALDSFRIPIALSLIHSHPERQWTLVGLAQEVNMSRSAFAAEFQASVGESPMRYLTRVRMTRAADLLRRGPIAVSDVAWQVGYQSVASFARAFKQFHSVTPTRFQSSRMARKDEGMMSQAHWAPFLADGFDP